MLKFISDHWLRIINKIKNKLENVPLFFLEFNGDTTNWSSSDTFHQVSDETGDLVPETLGRNNSDLLDDPLVSVEVQGQHHVVFL